MFHIASADASSQLLFAGCRFFLAGVLVLLLGTSGNFKLKKTEIPMAMTLAVFQTILQYVFFYMGLAHATGVKSSIINGANSFLVIIIASLIFHQEKLTGPKILGCIIGFAGVVLVNLGGAGLDMSFHWNGEFFILISTVSAACSSAFIKKFSTKANPVLLSGWQFMMGGTVLIIMGKLMGGKFQFEGIAPMFIIYGLYFRGGIYTLVFTFKIQSAVKNRCLWFYESGVWRHAVCSFIKRKRPGVLLNRPDLINSCMYRNLYC